MKQYTVAWYEDVSAELADLVVLHWGTPLGTQIADAANHIDERLSKNPSGVGSELIANVRLLVAYPLAVEYAVFQDDLLVNVVGLHLSLVSA